MSKNELLLEEIINLIPYDIFWKDRESNYLGANEAFAKAAGFRNAQELVGKCDYDACWSKEESDFFRKIDKEVMDSGKAILNIEEPQQQLDGSIKTLLTSKVPLKNSKDEVIGLLGIYTDITDRKNIELEKDMAIEELQQIQEKLIQNEKLRSIGQMAGGIAHEINNPLAVIAGKARIIKKLVTRDDIDRDKILKLSDELINTVNKASSVIQNLKDLSRQDTGDSLALELFKPSEVLNSVITLISLNKEIAFKLNIEKFGDFEKEIKSNKVSFEQSLFNIIDNAIYEQAANDQISISISMEHKTEGRCVKISNPGELIPSQIVSRIFDPYYTTKPVGEGTGLGLSLCKSLMNKCGGDIHYEVSDNRNTFVICIKL